MMSDPRLLGSFTTSADGAFAGQVDLPADLPSGDHTLVLVTATRSISLGVRVVGSGGLVPIAPRRLLDTRTSQPMAAGATVVVEVAGAAVPASATAVTVNVTVTRAQSAGHITVWPCGADRPDTSTLNFAAGADVANAATVGLGDNATVCVSSSAPTDVLVDVTGYVSPTAGDRFSALTARRLLDTRSVGQSRRTAGSVTRLTVASAPVGATAVALNVTAVQPNAAGFLTVWSCDGSRPNTSSLNFAAGDTVAGSVVAAMNSQRQLCVYTSAGSDVLVDVAGWFGSAGAAQFEVLASERVFDSRATRALLPGVVTRVSMGSTVPAGSTAVVNLTAVTPMGNGYVTATNCSATATEISHLNVRAGATRANQALVPVSTTGDICVTVSTPMHLIVDLTARMVVPN